jgi:hypothetical protein
MDAGTQDEREHGKVARFGGVLCDHPEQHPVTKNKANKGPVSHVSLYKPLGIRAYSSNDTRLNLVSSNLNITQVT